MLEVLRELKIKYVIEIAKTFFIYISFQEDSSDTSNSVTARIAQ